MPETPGEIDAAIEQVVKTGSDTEALAEAVRALAGLLGYGLVPKVRITTVTALEALPVGAVIVDDEGSPWRRDTDGYWVAAANRFHVSSDLRRVYGPSFSLAWPPPQDVAAGYETDADPKPRDGEHGTCVFGCAIRYFERDGLSWWAHETEPADGHDAEIGGSA
jgi:hypothetical protein